MNDFPIVRPEDKSKAGYYIVIKPRPSNGIHSEFYYSYDIWTGTKWIFADFMNSPIVDIYEYVGEGKDVSQKEINKRIKKLQEEE